MSVTSHRGWRGLPIFNKIRLGAIFLKNCGKNCYSGRAVQVMKSLSGVGEGEGVMNNEMEWERGQ